MTSHVEIKQQSEYVSYCNAFLTMEENEKIYQKSRKEIPSLRCICQGTDDHNKRTVEFLKRLGFDAIVAGGQCPNVD